MKRRFKESLIAEEVITITEKRLKALIAVLKQARTKEEVIALIEAQLTKKK